MRIPTSISAAVVAVATATLALTSAAGASAAPPKCADLSGVLVGHTCQIRATDPAYTLSIDYPIDYPEVEAILMVHAHRLRMCEVPVRMRARGGGESSIKGAGKSAYYMVKVLLALLVGLLRRRPTIEPGEEAAVAAAHGI